MSSHQKETTSQRKETGRRMVGRQAIATSITAILYKGILSEDQVKILLFFCDLVWLSHIFSHYFHISDTHFENTFQNYHVLLVSSSLGWCARLRVSLFRAVWGAHGVVHSWLALIGQCHRSVWSASTKTGGHAHARTLHTYHISGSWAILRQGIFRSNCEHLLTFLPSHMLPVVSWTLDAGHWTLDTVVDTVVSWTVDRAEDFSAMSSSFLWCGWANGEGGERWVCHNINWYQEITVFFRDVDGVQYFLFCSSAHQEKEQIILCKKMLAGISGKCLEVG